MSYDYCGYGQSSGKPNESNLNKACFACYEKLKERYNLRSEQIILYGQSIGTGLPKILINFRISFFLKYRQPTWRQKSTVPLSSSTRPSRAACAFSSPIQSARGFSTLSKSKKIIFKFFSKQSILQH